MRQAGGLSMKARNRSELPGTPSDSTPDSKGEENTGRNRAASKPKVNQKALNTFVYYISIVVK